MTKDQMIDVDAATHYLGDFGHRLGESTGEYKQRHRDHMLFIDAFVYTDEYLIWRGDIDFTLSAEALVRLSFERKKGIYVFKRNAVSKKDPNIPPNITKCVFYTDGTGDLTPADVVSFGEEYHEQ